MARTPSQPKSGKTTSPKSTGPDVCHLDLQRAADWWMAGAWSQLAVRDAALISHGRDKGLIAAYVACAHHFCDDHEAARNWKHLALEWGCTAPQIARVLVAGTHITIARLAAVAGDLKRARAHISESAEPIAGEQSQAHADARLSKELASLGLLNTSVQVIGEDLERMLEEPLGRVTRHRISILKSELIQVRQQLARHQLRTELSRKSGEASEEEIAKQHSMSQLGQDLWVLARTEYKRNGFFVEFGATDGVILSNTLLLEKMFNWKGLLSEPNPEYFAELKKNRSSDAFDACIAGKSGETVEFVLADEFGGIKDYIDRDRHASRRASYAELPEHVLTLTTVSLDDFLTQNGAPAHIDYISVDTEGSELDILCTFPFDKWDVAMWTIEHNFSEDREKIFEIMTANGYRRKEVRFDDWYYKEGAQG